jgi:hypothetical protein
MNRVYVEVEEEVIQVQISAGNKYDVHYYLEYH